MAPAFVSVEQAGAALGVSRSTVWRLIQRGALASVRRRGRRLVQATALLKRVRKSTPSTVAPFTHDHPILRLAGAGRGGGRTPGARDKHALVDR